MACFDKSECPRTVHHIYSGNVTDARILLLRPPTAVEMRKLEDEWFPEANQEFGKIAEELHVEFFDMHHEWKARNNHHFNDGHHMCIEGANAFSAFLATELLIKKRTLDDNSFVQPDLQSRRLRRQATS